MATDFFIGPVFCSHFFINLQEKRSSLAFIDWSLFFHCSISFLETNKCRTILCSLSFVILGWSSGNLMWDNYRVQFAISLPANPRRFNTIKSFRVALSSRDF
jgi:hypothetical protein